MEGWKNGIMLSRYRHVVIEKPITIVKEGVLISSNIPLFPACSRHHSSFPILYTAQKTMNLAIIYNKL